MTIEASQLMAEVLKCVKMNGDFMPADIGKRIGLSRAQSDVAARSLSNAGVLVIGFDNSAHYSEDYRKMTESAAAPKALANWLAAFGPRL